MLTASVNDEVDKCADVDVTKVHSVKRQGSGLHSALVTMDMMLQALVTCWVQSVVGFVAKPFLDGEQDIVIQCRGREGMLLLKEGAF